MTHVIQLWIWVLLFVLLMFIQWPHYDCLRAFIFFLLFGSVLLSASFRMSSAIPSVLFFLHFFVCVSGNNLQYEYSWHLSSLVNTWIWQWPRATWNANSRVFRFLCDCTAHIAKGYFNLLIAKKSGCNASKLDKMGRIFFHWSSVPEKKIMTAEQQQHKREREWESRKGECMEVKAEYWLLSVI